MVLAVESCTVPLMEDELKEDPGGTVIWIVATSTNPEATPAGKVPLITTFPVLASTLHVNVLVDVAELPAAHENSTGNPAARPCLGAGAPSLRSWCGSHLRSRT